MKKIIFAILNLFQILYAQQSPLIVNNYQKLTSYDELSEFVDQLEKSSKIAAVETIGKSIEGRNIYVLKFSSTEFGQDDSKIKVLVFAQQHGNEQSGKEGALLLAEELLKSENKYLFDKIDFALIPQMNPDGSEANKRRNGNDADLNRDHLILDQPENIALHKFFDKYLFEVSMDVHEYYPFGEDWKKYGYRRNFDETIGAPTNINVSAKIRDLANEKCIPYIFDRLREKDFTAFSYILGGPPEVDLMRYSTFDINDGRQSFAIQNTFSFIQEGMNAEIVETESIQKRAEGQMNGILSLLEFTYNNKEEIKNLVKEEREKLINNGSPKLVAIQLEHISDGSKLEIPLFSYHSQKDSLITVDD
ncbi:MAG: hypothetical protein KDC67_11230, partial [Ignavibacteriae bacterium]|nr:hypothetical protein [Ignavibacteriota bacterium]